jgi:nucleotide-binding universal stress UspA family protein
MDSDKTISEMPMLPRRILLASDGSEDAAREARTAIELSEKLGTELHLVYVEHVPSVFYLPPGFWEFDMELQRDVAERIEEEAFARLTQEVEIVREAGNKVAQVHERVGTPDEEIVKLAEELGVDLIVVGSRGLGLLKRVLMGSVSESGLQHADASVLVARGGPISFPTKILVATDGSEEATLAARTAADIAGGTGSELHVVRVGEVALVYHPERHGYLAQYGKLQEEARLLLDEQVERLRAASGTVAQAHLRMGLPDKEIVVLSEEIGAGLIVAGSRGLGPLKRALLGSVSSSVVRHAHRSVLVVREVD